MCNVTVFLEIVHIKKLFLMMQISTYSIQFTPWSC